MSFEQEWQRSLLSLKIYFESVWYAYYISFISCKKAKLRFRSVLSEGHYFRGISTFRIFLHLWKAPHFRNLTESGVAGCKTLAASGEGATWLHLFKWWVVFPQDNVNDYLLGSDFCGR